MATIADHGSWVSPISAALVTTAQVGLGHPSLDRGAALWLEARASEAGRTTLIRRTPDGDVSEITPAPFNVRNRVHEYGGGAYVVGGGVIVASNDADQRLYRLDAPGPGRALTPESERRLRFADLTLDLARRRVLAVREDHRTGGEPENSIVAISLDGGEGEGRALARGHDFFAAPTLSPDGDQLAWLTWDHPDMPWDATTLWLAEIDADGGLAAPRAIAGGHGEAVAQPAWSPDGVLHFVSDRSGWWNLHRHENGDVRPVCPMSAEFAGPAWAFGGRWYGFLSDDVILAAFSEAGRSQLATIEIRSGRATRLPLPYDGVSGLQVEAGQAIMRVGGPDRPSAILQLDVASGETHELCTGGDLPVDPAWLSRPEVVSFPTSGDERAHGLYYPPTNPEFAPPAGGRPPLIVKSHGGPTGSASRELRLATQFWTSRGFAVIDVDYRGSTGYGRAYRERLYGQWGVVDVDDCLAAARFLVTEGLADGERLAISGGSAGGYTTLAALTFHDLFSAGASHYGISDLEALAKDTHKFESRYLDRLIGPWPEAIDLYRARSPIHHVDQLACPIIFFQGLEDRVVPPSQAEMMVQALRRKSLPVAHLTFEGEQHGFRRAETIQTVLRAELAFYGRVLGFQPADGLNDLVIENL